MRGQGWGLGVGGGEGQVESGEARHGPLWWGAKLRPWKPRAGTEMKQDTEDAAGAPAGAPAGARALRCTRRTPGLCWDVPPNAGTLGLGDQRGLRASR